MEAGMRATGDGDGAVARSRPGKPGKEEKGAGATGSSVVPLQPPLVCAEGVDAAAIRATK